MAQTAKASQSRLRPPPKALEKALKDSADHWRGDALHHFGGRSASPHDGKQARQNDSHCHIALGRTRCTAASQMASRGGVGGEALQSGLVITQMHHC